MHLYFAGDVREMVSDNAHLQDGGKLHSRNLLWINAICSGSHVSKVADLTCNQHEIINSSDCIGTKLEVPNS